MAIARPEKFRFPDQSATVAYGGIAFFLGASLSLFLFPHRTLEESPLGGLEKSQARAASFPCSKFYCWFYVREPVDRGEQLPVDHVSRLFRASPLSSRLLFFFFFYYSSDSPSSPHSPLFLVASLVVRVYVTPHLFGRVLHRATTHGLVKHCARAFKGTPRFLTRPPVVPSAIRRHRDLNFKPYRKC